MINIEEIYKECGAYLKGHFLLSSGKHSQFYLQSAKVLEYPNLAQNLAKELANIITKSGIKVDSVCSPAIGGILAGYELARALDTRFIFAERVDGKMNLRRGFSVKDGETFIICEDIITTGGSALEVAKLINSLGGNVLAFAALANRGFCKVENLENSRKDSCKLPLDKPLFSLGNFEFEIYDPDDCPLCENGSRAIKPGSNTNHG
ncbi:orotate phosphoribosyltransferase [Campylobacter corcagiensis]|nr:orotate phosphoribosyltransferase [Campylobacter corcagiensis]